jgi:hypothetical protein
VKTSSASRFQEGKTTISSIVEFALATAGKGASSRAGQYLGQSREFQDCRSRDSRTKPIL